ncbi:MAG: SRPBCC domain-containing protein [Actinobacteria bacterium]|nr:SRPBCC domain-containing protein [Actinomycetota bacterium]
MNIRTIEQTVIINASPHEIYEVLMDSEKHSRLVGSKATISREVGGKFSIYDGYIDGTNIELEQDRKIVQDWRGEEDCWPKGHYSRLTIELEEIDGGTQLALVQSGVPEECYADFDQGWHDYYWEPLKEMLKEEG